MTLEERVIQLEQEIIELRESINNINISASVIIDDKIVKQIFQKAKIMKNQNRLTLEDFQGPQGERGLPGPPGPAGADKF